MEIVVKIRKLISVILMSLVMVLVIQKSVSAEVISETSIEERESTEVTEEITFSEETTVEETTSEETTVEETMSEETTVEEKIIEELAVEPEEVIEPTNSEELIPTEEPKKDEILAEEVIVSPTIAEPTIDETSERLQTAAATLKITADAEESINFLPTEVRYTLANRAVRPAKNSAESLGILKRYTKITGVQEGAWFKFVYNRKIAYVVDSYLTVNYPLVKPDAIINKYIRTYGSNFQVYFEDLNSGYIYTNSNRTTYPASLTKLYIMGTVYEAIEKGDLQKTSYVNSQLEKMIVVSDNYASNNLVTLLQKTYPKRNVFSVIDDFCKKYGFNSTIIHNYFAYGNYSYWYPTDKVMKTSAKDSGEFMAKIYKGQLVSKAASSEMLARLSRQQRTWKIPAGVPNQIRTANKTGEYDKWRHDTAIIYGIPKPYVLSVLTTGTGGDYAIRNLSRDVYKYLEQ